MTAHSTITKPTHWHDTPAVAALIDAMFALDTITAKLAHHYSAIVATGEDPAGLIGQVRHNSVRIGLAHGYGRRWETTGASATECCFMALKGLRDRWMDAQLARQFPHPWASQAYGDAALELERDTPTVDSAINDWVRAHSREAA
jgi:hypothetical protein